MRARARSCGPGRRPTSGSWRSGGRPPARARLGARAACTARHAPGGRPCGRPSRPWGRRSRSWGRPWGRRSRLCGWRSRPWGTHRAPVGPTHPGSTSSGHRVEWATSGRPHQPTTVHRPSEAGPGSDIAPNEPRLGFKLGGDELSVDQGGSRNRARSPEGAPPKFRPAPASCWAPPWGASPTLGRLADGRASRASPVVAADRPPCRSSGSRLASGAGGILGVELQREPGGRRAPEAARSATAAGEAQRLGLRVLRRVVRRPARPSARSARSLAWLAFLCPCGQPLADIRRIGRGLGVGRAGRGLGGWRALAGD